MPRHISPNFFAISTIVNCGLASLTSCRCWLENITNAVAGLLGAPCHNKTQPTKSTQAHRTVSSSEDATDKAKVALTNGQFRWWCRQNSQSSSGQPHTTAVARDQKSYCVRELSHEEMAGESHLSLGLLVSLLAFAGPPAFLLQRISRLCCHARVRVHVGVRVAKVRIGPSCRSPMGHSRGIRWIRVVRGWLPHLGGVSSPSVLLTPTPPPVKFEIRDEKFLFFYFTGLLFAPLLSEAIVKVTFFNSCPPPHYTHAHSTQGHYTRMHTAHKALPCDVPAVAYVWHTQGFAGAGSVVCLKTNAN